MADDLGWGDLAVYGSELLSTPRLDRMAAEGVRFTQVYAGASVCGPSRCVLMTGHHGGRCRLRDNLARRPGLSRDERLVPLRAEDQTVATLLRARGYATGGVGKWGLGDVGSSGAPSRQGFDGFYGYLDQLCAHQHYPTELVRDEVVELIPENANGAEGAYASDLFIDEMLSFIDRHQEEPFFLYGALTLPHLEWEVPELGRWADSELPVRVRTYAAMVERLDALVGRLLDHLEARGLSERTIVFFTSDNGSFGPFTRWLGSNGDLRGRKSQVYEGGIRVPMLVRWPGTIAAGGVSDAVWSHADFLPTASALAGGQLPAAIDGVSVLPTLLGREQSFDRSLYWEVHRPFAQAVRRGRWKGIRFGTRELLVLYDLEADRGETTDLASEHPELVHELELLLDTERVETPDWPAPKRIRNWRRVGRRVASKAG